MIYHFTTDFIIKMRQRILIDCIFNIGQRKVFKSSKINILNVLNLNFFLLSFIIKIYYILYFFLI